MLLLGVFPVILIGIGLPVGLVALLLMLKGAPVSQAVDQGELFLSGGNAAVTGCVVLVAARPERAVNAAISSLFILVLVVLPSYAAWAYIVVENPSTLERTMDIVLKGGLGMAVVGVALALTLVRIAYSDAGL